MKPHFSYSKTSKSTQYLQRKIEIDCLRVKGKTLKLYLKITKVGYLSAIYLKQKGKASSRWMNREKESQRFLPNNILVIVAKPKPNL